MQLPKINEDRFVKLLGLMVVATIIFAGYKIEMYALSKGIDGVVMAACFGLFGTGLGVAGLIVTGKKIVGGK